jgi:hypothetical protein
MKKSDLVIKKEMQIASYLAGLAVDLETEGKQEDSDLCGKASDALLQGDRTLAIQALEKIATDDAKQALAFLQS